MYLTPFLPMECQMEWNTLHAAFSPSEQIRCWAEVEGVNHE